MVPSLLAACPPWPPSVFVISLEGSLSQMAAQCKRMIVNITIFELPPFVTTCKGMHLMAAQVKLQMNFKCINLVLLKWTKILDENGEPPRQRDHRYVRVDDQIWLAKRIFLDNRALMPVNAGFNALLPEIDQYMRHMRHILG